MNDDALVASLLEIERHVAHLGWDQPARLFALVPTVDLLAAEPALAAQVNRRPDAPADALSAVEQDEFKSGEDVLGDLARIAWPETVHGCAIALERVFVPADVEAEIPDDPDAAADFVAHHPRRHDVRVVVGATRDGRAHGVARLRSQPDELVGGADLVPGLTHALARTLGED